MSTHDSPQKEQQSAQFQTSEGAGPEGASQSPPTFQLMASNNQATSAPIQRAAYETERNRNQGGNPINSAVSIVKSNYSGVGAGWLQTRHVAGIVYAESMLNTDLLDLIGDAIGSSSSVGPGQLTEAAINQVDASIGATARQQFEAQFGTRPAGWRDVAEDSNWAYYYTAGYLAWCMTDAAGNFQAVDGATSHIPLGIAQYQGAFVTMRNLRRRIAREKGIANTDVTWNMIELESRKPGEMSGQERQTLNYVQMGNGGFDFDFEIERELEGRTFYVPEGKAKVTCEANYVAGGGTGSYFLQLVELQTYGSSVRYVEHDKIRYALGRNQTHEWTGLPTGGSSHYAVRFINENGQAISGHGKVSTL